MSEVLKAIKERRSVREFAAGEAVTDGELQAILEAASYAPSAMDSQATHVTAVTGLARIRELDAALKKATAEPGHSRYSGYVLSPGYSVNFRDAPLFLIVGAHREASVAPKEDGSMVMANILLSAHALGLGAVWVNQLWPVADEPGFRAFLTDLGFPETHAVIGSAAVGRRAGPNPQAPPRKPGFSNIVRG
jgi:nitroreductase